MDMFMIFSLFRPDVMPSGDLGVRKGIHNNIHHPIDMHVLIKFFILIFVTLPNLPLRVAYLKGCVVLLVLPHTLASCFTPC